MKKLTLFLVVAATLAGCGENTPVQTVDWYKAHDTEQKDVIAKCKSNTGESRRGYLKLPPVDFNKKGE